MAVISSIQIDTKSARKSIADLEKELQEANEQLKQVDINSEAFKTLQKKAADAKGQLDRINQTTDTLSKGFQGFGENLAKVTGGISGGITAATAAMQLMGVENENVMAGIAKLQLLMAFTQGISALKDLSSGFRALGVATKAAAGPIGILVGVITGLVLIWQKWGDKLRNDYPIIDKVATAIENLKNKLVGVDEAVNKVVTNADALADIEKKLALIDTDKRVKSFNEEAKSTYNLLLAEQQRLDLLIKREGLLMKNAKSEKEFNEHKAKWLEYDAQRLAIEKRITDLFADRASYAQQIEDSGFDFSKYLNNNDDTNQDQQTPQAPAAEREEEEDDGWADKVTAAQNYYNTINQLEYSLYAAFQQMQAEKLAALQNYYKQGLISSEQYTAASKQLAEDEKKYKVNMSMQAANGIANILNSLASTMDSTNEKQFKAQKAMQISAATIQMMVGITTALSGAFTTKTGPWDIALAVIQATSIAASGAAQIAQIARTKYDSNGSFSSSIASSAASSIITPPTQYSSAVEGVEIESSIADSKVYVVESDIQAVGSKVNVQETENRY